MTEIRFNPKQYKVEIKGHAGYAEVGKDIVCSAVSILFYTLAECLTNSRDELVDDPIINMDGDGEASIQCNPKLEYEGNVMRTYWTILNGFQLLADSYEENVKIFVEG